MESRKAKSSTCPHSTFLLISNQIGYIKTANWDEKKRAVNLIKLHIILWRMGVSFVSVLLLKLSFGKHKSEIN